MNTDLVLVRGEWYFAGMLGWTMNLEKARTFGSWQEAERAIARRQAKDEWGNVRYMTLKEAREQKRVL